MFEISAKFNINFSDVKVKVQGQTAVLKIFHFNSSAVVWLHKISQSDISNLRMKYGFR